jgi:hypothetical protein
VFTFTLGTNLVTVRLFLNIICPPTLPEGKKFPVRVYIHGGYVSSPPCMCEDGLTLVQFSPVRLTSWLVFPSPVHLCAP